MNMDNNDPQLPEIAKALHIGKMNETELRRQERSVTWFSRQLHCDRRNVYNIFSRTSIDTLHLIRISHILQCKCSCFWNLPFVQLFAPIYRQITHTFARVHVILGR